LGDFFGYAGDLFSENIRLDIAKTIVFGLKIALSSLAIAKYHCGAADSMSIVDNLII